MIAGSSTTAIRAISLATPEDVSTVVVGSPSGCSGQAGSRRCSLPSSHAMIASESPMLMRHAHGGRIIATASVLPKAAMPPGSPSITAARTSRPVVSATSHVARLFRPGPSRGGSRVSAACARSHAMPAASVAPSAARRTLPAPSASAATSVSPAGVAKLICAKASCTAVRRRGGACPPRRCRVSAIRGVRVVVLRRSTQVAVGVADTRVHVLGRRGPVDGRDRLRAQEHQLDGLDEVDVAIVERR